MLGCEWPGLAPGCGESLERSEVAFSTALHDQVGEWSNASGPLLGPRDMHQLSSVNRYFYILNVSTLLTADGNTNPRKHNSTFTCTFNISTPHFVRQKPACRNRSSTPRQTPRPSHQRTTTLRSRHPPQTSEKPTTHYQNFETTATYGTRYVY